VTDETSLAFEKSGPAPSVEVVRDAWLQTPKPSVRKVADLLTRRGWHIHYRTVARYKASEWTEKCMSKDNLSIIARKVKKDEEAEALRRIHLIETSISPPPAAPGGSAAPPVAPPSEEEINREMRSKLLDMTDEELARTSKREMHITSIMVMRHMQARAGMMALVPKDTGTGLMAISTALDGQIVQAPSNGTMLNVTPGALEQPQPANPVLSAIAAFKKRTGSASPLSS
jgi:hypothetical protein